ncbi:uncharacterized protein LOC111084931 [Limulus polyphemus]|uniref:Uncharacterized protein LOC111084931 n=1 Tax=Limulus polyphemus TaxID=6850 RepID=A0ABM1S0W8_LIMPO|nr:uncharacterized protein LOC111084931 [Limulus polyphemus]
MRVKWNRNLDGFSGSDTRHGYKSLPTSRGRFPVSDHGPSDKRENQYTSSSTSHWKSYRQRFGIFSILRCRECCTDPAAEEGFKQSHDVKYNSPQNYTRLQYHTSLLSGGDPVRCNEKSHVSIAGKIDQHVKRLKHNSKVTNKSQQTASQTVKVVKFERSLVSHDLQGHSSVTFQSPKIFSCHKLADDILPFCTIGTNTVAIESDTPNNYLIHSSQPSYTTLEDNISRGGQPLTTFSSTPVSCNDSRKKKLQNPESTIKEDSASLECSSSLTKEERKLNTPRMSASSRRYQYRDGNTRELSRSCDDNSFDDRLSTITPLVFHVGNSKSVRQNNLTPPPGYKVMRVKPNMSTTLTVPIENLTQASFSTQEITHMPKSMTSFCSISSADSSYVSQLKQDKYDSTFSISSKIPVLTNKSTNAPFSRESGARKDIYQDVVESPSPDIRVSDSRLRFQILPVDLANREKLCDEKFKCETSRRRHKHVKDEDSEVDRNSFRTKANHGRSNLESKDLLCDGKPEKSMDEDTVNIDVLDSCSNISVDGSCSHESPCRHQQTTNIIVTKAEIINSYEPSVMKAASTRTDLHIDYHHSPDVTILETGKACFGPLKSL